MGLVLAEAVTFDAGDLILVFLLVIMIPFIFSAGAVILVAFGGYRLGLKKLKAPQAGENYEPLAPRAASPLLLATPLVLAGVGWAGRIPLAVLEPQLTSFLLVPLVFGVALAWGVLCARIELNRKTVTPKQPPETPEAAGAEEPPSSAGTSDS